MAKKSLRRLRKEGYKVVDIPSVTHPFMDKNPQDKSRAFGHYFIEKCTLVGHELPGVYFKNVSEVIERNTVYLYSSHKDALLYFEKKLFELKSKNLFQ